MGETSGLQKLLILAGVLAFGLTLWLMARAGAPDAAVTVGGNAMSSSAIGYKALAQTLERVGIRTATARHAPAQRAASGDGVLVLTDPPSEHGIDSLLEEAAEEELRVLLVLPKWNAQPSSERSGWAGKLELKPAEEINQLLSRVARGVYVSRGPAEAPWQGELAAATPRLVSPQLLSQTEDAIEPLLGGDSILFGRLKHNPNVFILADPDLINNAGLAQPENARIFGRILKAHLRTRLFVFDETLHGFERTPSLFHELSQFPLLLVSLHACLLFLLGVWAASARFGSALHEGRPFERGKRRLLENTVGLLDSSRYLSDSASRYLAMILRRTAHALSLTSDETSKQRLTRLAVIAASRGVTRNVEALADDIEDRTTRAGLARTLRLARELHAWSKELKGGADRS